MTYKELAQTILKDFNKEQQDQDVTVHSLDMDEYFPLNEIVEQDEDDVLDKGHKFLRVGNEPDGE
jgi:hypothetical protein